MKSVNCTNVPHNESFDGRDGDVQLEPIIQAGLAWLRDEQAVKIGAELFRAVDSVQELEGKAWLLLEFSQRFHLFDGGIQFQKPGMTAMVKTAVALDLLSCLGGVRRAPEHLPQITQPAFDF